MSLVTGGTTVRALWIRRDPWPSKTERVPCQLAEPPEGLGECTERSPCAVFALCQGRLRNEWSSPSVLQWLCVKLSLKCEQTLRERPFFEAEIIGIICVYLPLSSRSGTESSIRVAREGEDGLPVPGGIVLRRRILFLGSWAQESEVESTARAWVRRLAT